MCSFLQIFRTPEGMLSTEQGVYIAESISAKNTKQPKGRFRVYDSNDDLVTAFIFSSIVCAFSEGKSLPFAFLTGFEHVAGKRKF